MLTRPPTDPTSTYQSFADTGPSYSYLDLSRTRSDESLLWAASDEAAALVAELRASLGHPSCRPEAEYGTLERIPFTIGNGCSDLRSRSFSDLHSCAGSQESLRICLEGGNARIYHPSRYFPCSCSKETLCHGDNEGPALTRGSPSRSSFRRRNLRSFGGSWRSLLKLGGMSGSRGAKPALVVKKVPPPTVPSDAVSSRNSESSLSASSGIYCSSSSSSSSSSGGDHRASFASSVSEDSNGSSSSPRSPVRGTSCDPSQQGAARILNGNVPSNNVANGCVPSSSPSHYSNSQFAFPSANQAPHFAHLLCPKTSPASPHHTPPDATYGYLSAYQTQGSLEDQGIDVQSPGRSSPGSGSSTTGSTSSSGNCRNSTTSLDSGRASASTQVRTHRLSGQSYDSASILRHSYHSSSSSLGSLEHDGGSVTNVNDLLTSGVADSEVLRMWLKGIHFEEHCDKFAAAGYDLPTISRMTPEDLNAIGITKPAHRKKLKAEITKLNISDGLPDYIPVRMEDWLAILRLEEYAVPLKKQNYNSVEQVTQIAWEDLEEIGIKKLGHQKKMMLAIKRAKDIMAGKKFPNSCDNPSHHTYPNYGASEARLQRENGAICREHFFSIGEVNHANSSSYGGQAGSPGCLTCSTDSGLAYWQPGHGGVYQSQPLYKPHVHPYGHIYPMNEGAETHYTPGQVGCPPYHYRPDIVAVHVQQRGRCVDAREEPVYGTCQTFHPEQHRIHPPQGALSLASLPGRVPSHAGAYPPHRSYDDGDITPTNENVLLHEGGGTLPRHRAANKLRPANKIFTKTQADVHEVPHFAKDAAAKKREDKFLSMPLGSSSTPQGTPKKLPPPPPRRSNSISETTRDKSTDSQYAFLRRGLSYGYMGVKNNLQPDVTPDLPPPPPAPQDSGNHQHLPEDFPPPPPPLTCLTLASSARGAVLSTAAGSLTASSDSSSSSSLSLSELDGEESVFRSRRNDSNASFKSTSSTDSADSIPFANDNAGTIKQRAARGHPISLIDTRSPRSSPMSSPALRRKDGVVTPAYSLVNNPVPLGSVAPHQTSSVPTKTSKETDSSATEPTGDVLNDIGNMLANLTDELEAMLVQERALKH